MVENFRRYRIKSNSLENIHSLAVRSSLMVSDELNPKIYRHRQTTVKHACARMWIVTGIIALLNAGMTEKEFETNVLLHTLQW